MQQWAEDGKDRDEGDHHDSREGCAQQSEHFRRRAPIGALAILAHKRFQALRGEVTIPSALAIANVAPKSFAFLANLAYSPFPG